MFVGLSMCVEVGVYAGVGEDDHILNVQLSFLLPYSYYEGKPREKPYGQICTLIILFYYDIRFNWPRTSFLYSSDNLINYNIYGKKIKTINHQAINSN